MIADPFDDRHAAGVANRETLAADTGEEGLAIGRAIHHGVADDDVVLRVTTKIRTRLDDEATARQTLADVVIALAGQFQCYALGQEGAETLAGGAGQLDVNGIVRQAGISVAAGHFARQHGAAGAVDVGDLRFDPDRLPLFERRPGLLDQLVIERLGQTVILIFGMAPRHLGRDRRLMENLGEIQTPGLPVLDAGTHVEQVGAADQIIELANAEPGHDFAHFLGNEEEIIDHMFRLTGEALAQLGILRRNADRASIQVALAHHDAAFDHQRRGGETEFIGAEQRADDDVATGLHLTVDLDANARTQTIEHQRLLSFGQAELPRRARMLDRRLRRCTGAAIETGDHDVVGLGLGDTGGNRTDTDFGNQFDRDRSPGVGVLQVMDQLRQIFDRVDIVVRRR